MPKLKTSFPRYCKHGPSGQAYVKLGGKMVYLGPYGTARSRAEYDRLIAEWIAAGREVAPLPSPSKETTVVELCAAYLRHAREYYHGKALQTRILNALRLLKKLYGRKPAHEFGPLGLKAIRHAMLETGASRRYINDTAAEVKRIFKWGASEELVSHEVYHKLQTVAGLAKGRTTAKDPEPIGPVADGIVDQTLPYLSPVVQAMVKLQRLSGVRPAEVCIMRPLDIDRSGEVWVYTPVAHKTEWRGKKRQVAIGPRAQEILLPFLLRDAKSYCFDPREAVEKWQRAKRQNRKTKVQPSQADRSKAKPKRKPGNRYTTPSYRRAIHRACEKAGVDQ